jgi:hypothetical protein
MQSAGRERGKRVNRVVKGPLTVKFLLRGAFFMPSTMPCGPEVLHLGGHEFELTLLSDYFLTKQALDATNWNAITASLTVRGVHEHEIPSIEEAQERICWLFSFAGGALVAFVERTIEGGPTKMPLSYVRNVNDTKKPFMPPIELREPGTIRSWLETSYGPFVIHERQYLLPNVIHMLSLADAEHNLTIQALLVASTLEILRYSFAQNVLVSSGRAIFKKGLYDLDGKPLSFGKILNSLTSQLNITACRAASFVPFRNSIIHQGQILGNSFQEKHQSILEALHFCHVLVLTLLEWDKAGGQYIPVTSGRAGPRKFVR